VGDLLIWDNTGLIRQRPHCSVGRRWRRADRLSQTAAFTRGLGISFVDQVTKERVSTPICRVECDFVRASKIGDVLRFRLVVGRIGTSSIQVKFEVRHGEEVRVRAKLTVVRASLDTFKAVPISQDLRRRMERYLAPAD
jgi:4-hydroxybenzoyl-CoA thioesterase